jgi:methylthioribulose-1-phosphate dehydratase
MMFAESWPDQAEHSQLLQSLCAAVRSLGARGWTPVRSGNFSVRLTPEQIAITASACDKVNLQVADLMLVDQSGNAADSTRTPSAECLLHVHLYRRFAHVGCVLHTHSMSQTLASLRYAQAGALALSGYELLKAMHGYSSHLQSLQIPVVANDQYMPDLVTVIDPLLDEHSRAYLIAGHGMYCWGADVASALRHAEALDFMLGCELNSYTRTEQAP